MENSHKPIRKTSIRMKFSILEADGLKKKKKWRRERNGYLPETSLQAILLCNFVSRRSRRRRWRFSFLCFFFESSDSEALQVGFGGWN
jgi:hypothetical protein